MKQSIKFGFTFPRRRWLIAFSLLFVISSNETSWSASPEATATKVGREGLASVLQPDGTLRAGVAGSFDASGYRMKYGPNGVPRFVAQAVCGTPDWDGQFGLNGTNDLVNALAVSGNTIFVGGTFTAVGNVAANHVAKFDTTTNTWSALSQHTVVGDVNGVNDEVYALAVSGNSVFVGGAFTTAGTNVIVFANGVARFDLSTNTWSALKQGNGNGVSNFVQAMAVSGNSLYVGGVFASVNLDGTGATPEIPANNVAKFDLSTKTWSALKQGNGNGVNDEVEALLLIGSNLFVGGAFTTANLGGTGATPAITANAVVKFDTSTNTWSALKQGDGNGVNSGVAAMAAIGNTLFLGGGFTSVNQGGTGATPAITVNKIARFDTVTNTWSALSQGNWQWRERLDEREWLGRFGRGLCAGGER
jgi:N-acetylneuraminic acid mutarotase